jgi:hypothetical protein
MALWHVGDVWKPRATVIDPETETAVEPGAVSFSFLSPRGKRIAGTPVKIKTGVYTAAVELSEPGPWSVSVESTAPYQASQPEAISVLERFG